MRIHHSATGLAIPFTALCTVSIPLIRLEALHTAHKKSAPSGANNL